MRRARMMALVTGALAAAAGAHGQDPELPTRHALVIGVNKPQVGIKGVDQLRFAEKDVTDVEKALKSRGFTVVSLPGSLARRETIVGALASLARETKPQDTVLIYFSGHGVRAKWAKKGGHYHTYWLTYDATVARMEEEGLRLEHVMDYVDDIPAAKKLVVLDHCHSGTVDPPKSAPPPSVADPAEPPGGKGGTGDSEVVKDLILPDVPAEYSGAANQRLREALLILGSAADPTAYEVPTLKNGIFTSALLTALTTTEADAKPDGNGNGELSAEELVTYLNKKVTKIAEEHSLKQQPIHVPRGNVFGWELMSLPLDPGAEANVLRSILGRLAAAGLDDATENAVSLSINNWAGAKRNKVPPSDRDQLIVQRLQGIHAKGAAADWASEAGKLPGFVQGLP